MVKPCSQVTKFILNTVVGPLLLLGLVQLTWWLVDRDEKHKNENVDIKASRSSDFYFAFFLSCERCRRSRVATDRC